VPLIAAIDLHQWIDSKKITGSRIVIEIVGPPPDDQDKIGLFSDRP
jgi:hypothetical protein